MVIAFYTSGLCSKDSASHTIFTTRHADSICNISDWSHLTQPKPPLRRGSPESLAHAPHSCRKHTTSELGVTGIRLPYTRTAYLSYRQLSIARKPAFLSPCFVWNPELRRQGPAFRLFTRQQGPPWTNETTHAAEKVAVCCHLASIE
jgi:hypothetical protein